MATKKKLLKQLKEQAEGSALLFRQSHEIHKLKGSEMIANGQFYLDPLTQLKPVDPEKYYYNPMPVQIAVNHTRKLKKLHKRYGPDVVPVYLEAIEESVKIREQQNKF